MTYIASDWREVHVSLPLSWRTRNYVGTIFGGSLYGAVDPLYMIMLIHALGRDYTVWDKAATIRFLKPGRATLFARFLLDEAEIETIRRQLETARSIDRVYDGGARRCERRRPRDGGEDDLHSKGGPEPVN